MSDIVIPKNYIASLYANDFCDLCRPLLDSTSISACFYIKLYRNNDYFNLATNMKLHEYMFINAGGKFCFDIKILDSMFANKVFYKNKNKIYVVTHDINNYWDPLFEIFNIKSSFNIIEKFNDYYETFWFIATSNKPLYSFCTNHYDVLERFIVYCREQSGSWFKTGKKIIWTNANLEYCKMVQNLKEKTTKKNNHITDLEDAFRLERYPISGNDIKTYVTIRELECLSLLSKGFTYKGIGNILDIRDRTVYTHIQHIKSKLKVNSQNQLLKIYHSSPLINLNK